MMHWKREWLHWREVLAALAVSSGQAASAFAIENVAQAGDNFISSTDLYGGTVNLFTHTLKNKV